MMRRSQLQLTLWFHNCPLYKRVSINKNQTNKTLHLEVEINNYTMEGLVDVGVSIFVPVTTIVRELQIMHMVGGSKSYKITSRVVTQAMGKNKGLPIWIGETNCNMVFMIVDTNSYDLSWTWFPNKNWSNCWCWTRLDTNQTRSWCKCVNIVVKCC